MRICVILEGCYPYVTGGVSTWMHQYIKAMPEHEFVLWTIGASSRDRGKFKYELPDNVTEVHEIFLQDALNLPPGKKKYRLKQEELRFCCHGCLAVPFQSQNTSCPHRYR